MYFLWDAFLWAMYFLWAIAISRLNLLLLRLLLRLRMRLCISKWQLQFSN
jgi:hypothetical protein